jgi:hypothetical protein
MLSGVAVIVTSLIVSALIAVIVDTAYQAIADTRWRAAMPLVSGALAVVSGVAAASLS